MEQIMEQNLPKYPFFSDISENQEERINKIAEISLMLGLVRLEMENAGACEHWISEILKAQEKLEDLI